MCVPVCSIIVSTPESGLLRGTILLRLIGVAMRRREVQRVEIAGPMGRMNRHAGKARLFKIVHPRGTQQVGESNIHEVLLSVVTACMRSIRKPEKVSRKTHGPLEFFRADG